MDIILFRTRNNKAVYLFMIIGTIVCILMLGSLVISTLYFLRYEAERLDKAGEVDIKIPVLNTKGLNYFISRQAQREKDLSPPLAVTTTPTPEKK